MIDTFADIPDPELELEGFDVGRGTEVHNAEVKTKCCSRINASVVCDTFIQI